MAFEWFKLFKDRRRDLLDDATRGDNKEEIPQLCVEISREEDLPKIRPAQTHGQGTSSGHSHHCKTLSKLVKIFPVFIIAVFSFLMLHCPPRKRFQDVETQEQTLRAFAVSRNFLNNLTSLFNLTEINSNPSKQFLISKLM
jgi:hypothetical protein